MPGKSVHLSLSPTLILLSRILVGHILCKMFHCNTPSLASFVVFQAVCHTSSLMINPFFSAKNYMQLGQYFVCWSLISFSPALVFRCIALLHMVILYTHHCVPLLTTQTKVSVLSQLRHCIQILRLHYSVLVVL